MSGTLFYVGTLAPIAERLGLVLLHSVWEGAAVAGLLALVLACLRSASASVRYLVACAALLMCLAMPIATFVWLSVDWRGEESALDSGERAETPRLNSLDRETHSSSGHARQSSGTTIDGRGEIVAASGKDGLVERVRKLLPLLALAWGIGVIVTTIYRIGGWMEVRRLVHRGTEAVDERWTQVFQRMCGEQRIAQRIRVLQSRLIDAPALIGWLRPVVLLPIAALTGLSAEHIAAVLAHELAHVRRNDYLVNLVQTAVETLLFYHPAAWWMSRRIRIERENCCDDLAAAAVGSRVAYAKALAELESLRGGYALALAATDGGLLSRIKRLSGRQEEARSSMGAVAAMGLVLGLLIFGLTASRSLALGTAEIHVAAGASIQKAIDGAPDGAVIDIGPGVFDEYLDINKPVTLRGAGWDKTILKPTRKPLPHTDAEKIALADKLETSSNQTQLINDYFHEPVPATICVCATKGVILRGLRIEGIAPTERAGSGSPEIMSFDRAEAQVIDCVVMGPSRDGIVISGGSNVVIRNTLVAAVWNVGVAVGDSRRHGNAGEVHLVECDIRNCYYTGVILDSNRSSIEKCRISGCAWHGIRYDNCSPTITGNLIFANARSGIYASGTTHATVRNNVIWKNEIDGMSCWSDNQDVIERNTIVGNLRDGISVLGNAKPTVANDVVAFSTIAIFGGGIAGQGGGGSPQPAIKCCIFCENGEEDAAAFEISGVPQPFPAGCMGADPGFADAAKFDFSLPADSFAAQAGVGIGTGKMLPLTSPWPLQPEELAIIPTGDTRDYAKWKKPASVQ